MYQFLKAGFYFFFTFLLLSFPLQVLSQDSENMTLLSNWDEVPEYSDIWGYADENGEYAIIGSYEYTHFINITNPSNPVEVARFEGASNSYWRDYKTYQHYAYAISENSGSLQIFDLSGLPATVTKVYDSTTFFSSCHNIFIDEANGRLYAVGTTTNVIILDLTQTPANPTLLGNITLNGGYVHDMYVKNHIGYCSHGNYGLEVYDFTDVNNVVSKGSLTSYQQQGYNHSSWLSADGKTLVMADETKNTAVKIVSVEDLADMQVVSTFKSTLEEAVATNSIAHNPFIIGNDFAVISYYHDGVQVYDISDPSTPTRVAYYDTDATNTNYSGGIGSWGVYPYLPSGNIIASDIYNGLFVLQPDIDLSSTTTTVPINPIQFTATQTVTYVEDLSDFPNPERGFYRYSATSSTNYELLDSTTLADYRKLHTPYSADYEIYSTLVFRYFLLEDFLTSPISQAYLTNMQKDFEEARKAGVKLIPRFTYTTTSDNSCGQTACAPFGDASKAQILAHIAQLKPLLQANKDIIATLQMGFIGIWGEQYYTDHFGYAGTGPLSAENIEDRNEVLNALLDALPPDRMVQARIPQYKQKAVYGTGATTTAAPLTITEAYNETNKARIGHHNDCFLTSFTDYGTYIDLNNNNPDTTILKPYLAADSKYVVVGGETCGDINPRSNCADDPDSGDADIELRRFHYSYLNSQYNNDVNNDWKDYCLEDIKRYLGYRFVLEAGTYPVTTAIGSSITINFQLKNVGYAAPYNPRKVELLLRNTSNPSQIFKVPLTADPRLWLPNTTITIEEQICMGYDLTAGMYDLLLHLPDPEPALYGRPEYSIRLANEGVWEATTGYNVLVSGLEIQEVAYHGICEESLVFGSKECGTKLLINNIPTPVGTYHANDFIISSSDISENEDVTFIATDYITLRTGFHAKSGSTFLAAIGTCPPAMLQETDQPTNTVSPIRSPTLIDQEITATIPTDKQSLSIFPNPFKETATIAIELSIATPIQLDLYDINGRWIKEVASVDYKEAGRYVINMPLPTLEKGMYFLILQTSQETYKQKLVKL